MHRSRSWSSWPGPWALGAVVALPFVNRRPSLVRLAGLLLPAQLLYHTVFGGSHGSMSTAAASAAGNSMAANSMAGMSMSHQSVHQHSGALSLLGVSTPGSGRLASGTIDTMTASAAESSMLTAHLLSAVLSVLLIRHAERSLAAAWRWCSVRLAPGARLPRVPATPRRAPRPAPVAAPVPPLALGLPLASLRHRGPPASLAHA